MNPFKFVKPDQHEADHRWDARENIARYDVVDRVTGERLGQVHHYRTDVYAGWFVRDAEGEPVGDRHESYATRQFAGEVLWNAWGA